MIFRSYFLHRLINFFLALISWLFKEMFNANWETSFKIEYHLFSTDFLSFSVSLFQPICTRLTEPWIYRYTHTFWPLQLKFEVELIWYNVKISIRPGLLRGQRDQWILKMSLGARTSQNFCGAPKIPGCVPIVRLGANVRRLTGEV